VRHSQTLKKVTEVEYKWNVLKIVAQRRVEATPVKAELARRDHCDTRSIRIGNNYLQSETICAMSTLQTPTI